MRRREHYQVIYLYHLPIEGPLGLGDFTLWPYYKNRGSLVKDKPIQKYLDRLFGQMRDYRRKPLKHIAILTKGDSPDFRPISKEDLRKLQDAVNALFCSAVVENNTLNALSANNFHLIVQNFTPDTDDWAIEDGSYIRVGILGLKIKDAGVRLPPHLTCASEFQHDAKLLDGLISCLYSEGETTRKRIFPSLQWLMYSYDNSPRFPYHNRILQLMIAFDILGSCPKSFNRWRFASWLEKTWRVQKNKSSTAKKDLNSYGPLGRWGVDFYCLRNDIIHNNKGADELPVFDAHGREYFKFGVFVFSECVKELLSQKGCFTLPHYTNMIRAWRLAPKSDKDD